MYVCAVFDGVYMCICIYVLAWVHMHACACVYVCAVFDGVYMCMRIHLLEWVHVCVRMCMSVWVCACVCVGGKNIWSLQWLSALVFETGTHRVWNSMIQLNWLANKPQGFSCLCFPRTGIIAMHILPWVIGIRTQALMPAYQALYCRALASPSLPI